MADEIKTTKDDCKCGHDRTHHYQHSDRKRYCCLAMRCDCSVFREPETPDPPGYRPQGEEKPAAEKPWTPWEWPHT